MQSDSETQGPSTLSDRAALLVIPAVVLTFWDLLTGRHAMAEVALILVAVFVLSGWSRLKPNARIMMVAAGAVLALAVALGVRSDDLAVVASRIMYLPALVLVMTLLRVAAQPRPMVTGAGHFVVEQPPRRRFFLLTIGSHIFGILLNVGGFLLLTNIAHRTVLATAPDERIREIQIRRVSTAITRGFACTLFWSPLGVAMNLLLPIFPGLTWLAFLPYGLGGLALFIGVSLAMDLLEPRPRAARAATTGRGKITDLLGLLATLFVIAGSAGLAEALLNLPLRAAILLIVPAYAIGWCAVAAGLGALPQLGGDTLRVLPGLRSEIAVMTASGLVGLTIAAILPGEWVAAGIDTLGLSGAALGCAVGLAIFVLSLTGISPVITGTLFVAAIYDAGSTLADPLLMLASLIGWSAAVIVSPMTATIAISSGVLDKPASVVGLKWNGATAVVVLVLGGIGLTLAA